MKNGTLFFLLIFLLVTFTGFSQKDYSGFFLVNENEEGIPLRELEKEEKVYIDSAAVIQLTEIKEMDMMMAEYQGGIVITFQLNDLGTKKLKEVTKTASIPSQRMALVLENVVLSNASLNSEITNGIFSLSGFNLIKAQAVMNKIKDIKAKQN